MNRTLVEKRFTELAARTDVRKEAFPDVVNRALADWSVGENGAISAAEAEDLTPDAWLDGLRTSSPHYFEASTGGGATGGNGSGSAATRRVRSKADLKTAKDKSDFITEHGFDAFAKLPVARD